MANVILGRAGDTVLVDLDVCVKTGRVTRDRLTLRGQTTPAWVTLLLFVSIIGFLIAGSMTSRRYRVTLPFSHGVHDRWRANRRWAWLVGIAGVGVILAAATVGAGHAGLLLGAGVSLLVGSTAVGSWNATRNNVGIHVTRDGDLLLTRAHPAFADAVRTATTRELSSR